MHGAYPAASTSDPLLGDSFKSCAINAPAGAASVELLDTPTVVWSGMRPNPTLLATRAMP